MRLLLPRAICLASPTALAFFAGGFNDRSRHIALIATAAGLALAALLAPSPLPTGRAARVILGALGLFCGWTALSAMWAPIPYQASDDAQRVLLYLVVFAIAAAVWRPRRGARWVEPVLAAGTVGVSLVGLAGRLVPTLVVQHGSERSGGRLDQPLTYWNAQGALAAMGLVLCARIAGDRERRTVARMAAAAGTVPLTTALYLTFSRGALAALAAGMLVLLVAAPTWSQLRAVVICAPPSLAGALAAGVFGSVRFLGRNHVGERLTVLAVLAAGAAVAAGLTWLAVRREARSPSSGGRIGLPRWSAPAVAVIVVGLVVVPIVVGGANPPGRKQISAGASNQRLSELGSNRPEYWRVAVDAFAEDPVRGVGSSGFSAEWLRRRHITEGVHDAHSLEIETLAELGLVGVALLAALFAGAFVAIRRVHGADPMLAAGPLAALVAWTLHSAIDWDWEMPALTLVAVILLGMLVAQADAGEAADGR
jgi:hypothetical protein